MYLCHVGGTEGKILDSRRRRRMISVDVLDVVALCLTKFNLFV